MKLFSTKKAMQTKYAPLNKDNVVLLGNPEENADLLTGLLRSGARDLITKAVQAELTDFFPSIRM